MRLTDKYTCKGKETYRISNVEKESKALTKLGKLEDIEQELGIDLITLLNVIKNGFYVKDKSGYIDYRASYDNLGDEVKYAFIVDYKHKELRWMHNYMCGRVHPFVYGCPTYKFKDYGKTWALTKEELEK